MLTIEEIGTVYNRLYKEEQEKYNDAYHRCSITGQTAYATSSAMLSLFYAELRCLEADKKLMANVKQ